MHMMDYLIGIDLGTSSTKTIIINSAGEIIAEATESYPLYQPNNGWAEQKPEDWAKATFSTVKNVVNQLSFEDRKKVKGIGFSGQMHGLVMLNKDYELIRDCIIWSDQRASDEVDDMVNLLPEETWINITGNPPMAAWTAAKILWVRKNEPAIFAKCSYIMLPKDYVRFRLTGVLASDVSDASGMQMMNVEKRCWSDLILEKLEIKKEMLGRLYESCEIVGNLLPEIADYLDLSSDVKVIAGAADNAAAAVGTGVVSDSEAMISLGTSGVLYTHLDDYKLIDNGSLHLCCSAVPGTWFSMGTALSTGLSLKWFKDNFGHNYIDKAAEMGKSVYTLIDEMAATVKPGSDRLIYLSFLMGERTPRMNPKYRGAFVGLSSIHTQKHFFRAIMEGVSYTLADCNNVLKSEGINIKKARVCGGGAKSPLWRQVLANLFGCDLYTLETEEGPAFGAAILAGYGAEYLVI